jgi:hypothetical protein
MRTSQILIPSVQGLFSRAAILVYLFTHPLFLACIEILLLSLLSLGDRFDPMAAYVPTGPSALVSRVQDDPVPKTVEELVKLDPFVDMVI